MQPVLFPKGEALSDSAAPGRSVQPDFVLDVGVYVNVFQADFEDVFEALELAPGVTLSSRELP